MGQPDPNISVTGYTKDEQPVHRVKVDGFFISKYEITNAQYAKFLNEYGTDVVKEGIYRGQLMIKHHWWGIYKNKNVWTPHRGYENHPVLMVSWYGAWAYCKFYGVRLPTEAEWEFAARGGNKSKRYKYSGGNHIEKIGWFDNNSGNETHQVGRRQGNELGLYDMIGNVQEWCADWYGREYYRDSPTSNPTGLSSGRYRVLRGGSWRNLLDFCRVAGRHKGSPDHYDNSIGFRVVYTP